MEIDGVQLAKSVPNFAVVFSKRDTHFDLDGVMSRLLEWVTSRLVYIQNIILFKDFLLFLLKFDVINVFSKLLYFNLLNLNISMS